MKTLMLTSSPDRFTALCKERDELQEQRGMRASAQGTLEQSRQWRFIQKGMY
jgi:hypothetical protein